MTRYIIWSIGAQQMVMIEPKTGQEEVELRHKLESGTGVIAVPPTPYPTAIRAKSFITARNVYLYHVEGSHSDHDHI